MSDTGAVDCSEVIRDLFRLLDGELPELRCAQLQGHIDKCHDCFARYGLEKDFKEFVKSSCAEQSPPQDLVERIRSALRSNPG